MGNLRLTREESIRDPKEPERVGMWAATAVAADPDTDRPSEHQEEADLEAGNLEKQLFGYERIAQEAYLLHQTRNLNLHLQVVDQKAPQESTMLVRPLAVSALARKVPSLALVVLQPKRGAALHSYIQRPLDPAGIRTCLGRKRCFRCKISLESKAGQDKRMGLRLALALEPVRDPSEMADRGMVAEVPLPR